MTTVIYGIKNCDTMKKAFKWLDENSVHYDFHDYKKLGAPENLLGDAINDMGWETVINRRGMTWRMLDDDTKQTMDADKALALALEKPSVIKRPMLAHHGRLTLGFDAEAYEAMFDED